MSWGEVNIMDIKYKPIWIDPQLQPKLKAHCARHNISMKTFVESLIMQHIKDDASRNYSQKSKTYSLTAE
jgi:hypothetical protein